MAGNRAATNSAYQSAWVDWADLCVRRGKDPLRNDLIPILSHLSALFESGKSYNTINISRSMLSSTLSPIEGFLVGSHPMVIRLLRGCYNLNPPRTKYNSTWDPEVIFNYLKRLAENEDLNLKLLSAKLVTLIALSSLLRVSEIASICRASVSFTSSAVSFQLTKPRKAQHQGPLKVISLPTCPERSICPVRSLGSYLYETDPIRTDASAGKLVLSTTFPHHDVTGSTVGRWIKSVMREAGINIETFSAHSARSAAAFKAFARGVPVDSILRSAHWSSNSTFQKFYHKAMIPDVASAVLGI